MIGYSTIGSKDLDKAVSFYDELLSLVGGKRLMELDRIKFYGTEAGGAMLAVCTCLLYTSPSPRDLSTSRMPSSA